MASELGSVLLVDRATRTVADRFELQLDAAMAAELLGRGPDATAEHLASWAHVTADEIDGLLAFVDDEDGRALWRELLARHAGRDHFITLAWDAET